MNRRDFAKTAGLAFSFASVRTQAQQPARKLKAGHTGITWDNNIPQAVEDCGKLGFQGFETFGQVIDAWDKNGGINRLLDENRVPLVSAYCGMNLVDPAKRKDELAKMIRWGQLLKKSNGKVVVIGPNSVNRDTYVFNDHKADIVASLNEAAKALTDLGMTPVLHQHTGTCVMTREETYGVLEAVDTRYVKFGPDVGQLAKGRKRPGEGSAGFSSYHSARPPERFRWRQRLPGLLPAGSGQS